MWNGWTGIDLLMPFQELRESLPDMATKFFETMSSTVFYLAIPVLLGLIIYWFADKRLGDRYITNIITAFNVVNFIKFIFKQPRPWMIDGRIHPAESSLEDAGGYSLPSGHAAISASGYGYAAYIVRRYWLKIMLLAVCVCIIFARLFLCVHTPVDIVLGLAIAICMVIVNGILADISEKNDTNFYVVIMLYLAVFIIFTISVLVNIDTDYLNSAITLGMLYGLLIGKVTEHRYINYVRPEMSVGKGILIALIGLIVLGVFLVVPLKIIENDWLCFFGGLVAAMWLYVYPYFIMKMCD